MDHVYQFRLVLLSEPSAAPQNFTAHFNATSHDSIFLSWDPLPSEDQNGIVLGYLINITDISREDTQQFSSDTHNLTIELLRPHTTYTCLVAAYTSVEMGPFSVEISVQTLETSEYGQVSLSIRRYKLMITAFRSRWYCYQHKWGGTEFNSHLPELGPPS